MIASLPLSRKTRGLSLPGCAWAVIAPAYDAVSFSDGPAVLAESLRALTPGQRALLALHWCVAEVSNGGFDQFFSNSTGVLAPEGAAAFRALGMAGLHVVAGECGAHDR